MKKLNKKNLIILILIALAVLGLGGYGISRIVENNKKDPVEEHSDIEYEEEEVIEIEDDMGQGGF